MSAKEHFLPPTHALLSIHREKGGFQIEEPDIEDDRVIFGLHPCDARALRVHDALFLERAPVDPYYAERRKRTTLIGLTCQEMDENCFCTSLKFLVLLYN